jgi:predicted nucleic acid-binding protein
MRHLLDTGILVRIPHRADPLNSEIREALRRLAGAGHTFVATRQNIAEFWNVCTRPAEARGGFGLSTDEAARRLRMLERFVEVLSEPNSAYSRWKSLVQKHSVLGRQVHDARIVSVMAAHRIKRIVTLNETDFFRYVPTIIALTPSTIISSAMRR